MFVSSGTVSSETLVPIYQTTRCDVSHDYNTKVYCCENLKYRTQPKRLSLPTVPSSKHDSEITPSTFSRHNLLYSDPY
jgi:hypothetical protein